jgi:hypothetical protein
MMADPEEELTWARATSCSHKLLLLLTCKLCRVRFQHPLFEGLEYLQ